MYSSQSAWGTTLDQTGVGTCEPHCKEKGRGGERRGGRGEGEKGITLLSHVYIIVYCYRRCQIYMYCSSSHVTVMGLTDKSEGQDEHQVNVEILQVSQVGLVLCRVEWMDV